MGADLDPSIGVRLDQSPVLAEPHRTVERLTGGLTNQNFVVSTGAGRFVARLAGQSSELLAIDRDAEYRNCLAAAATGIAPAVIDYRPAAGVLVVQFLSGRTLTESDVRDAAMVHRIASACRTLHSAPRFVSDFDMFSVQRRYLNTAQRLGLRLPDGYTDFMSQVHGLHSVLAVRPSGPGTVPCHNDLLAENIIDDGDRLWIIDYEYSGNNDPCFELGNVASESHLPTELLVELVDAYFGRHDRQLIARTQLQQVMSQYGWTLWGVIQKAASTLDVDFWAWSMDKYERAAATLSGDHFDRLVLACCTTDP